VLGRVAVFLLSVSVVCTAGTASAAVTPAATSTFFAGYVEHTAVTKLTGVVSAPALTCPSSDSGANDSIQTGGTGGGVGSFVSFGCKAGKAVYSGQLFVSPAPGTGKKHKSAAFAVAAGDLVRTTIVQGPAVVTVTATNLTTHKSVQLTTRLVGVTSTGLYQFQDISRPVVPFGTAAFTSCRVNGTSLGSTHPTLVNLVNRAGKVLARTSKFTAGGTAFTVKRVAS
jgi:hypothetical protein